MLAYISCNMEPTQFLSSIKYQYMSLFILSQFLIVISFLGDSWEGESLWNLHNVTNHHFIINFGGEFSHERSSFFSENSSLEFLLIRSTGSKNSVDQVVALNCRPISSQQSKMWEFVINHDNALVNNAVSSIDLVWNIDHNGNFDVHLNTFNELFVVWSFHLCQVVSNVQSGDVIVSNGLHLSHVSCEEVLVILFEIFVSREHFNGFFHESLDELFNGRERITFGEDTNEDWSLIVTEEFNIGSS
mmetsp:Transcript_45720/g.52835  ORF Transcript_45720/g.52835 Transcript_45720/m.52835 type:complete len:245 (-) Transcript_45720:144-878(-)